MCVYVCVCGGGGLQKFLLLKRAGEQRGKGQTRRGTLSALFLLPSFESSGKPQRKTTH